MIPYIIHFVRFGYEVLPLAHANQIKKWAHNNPAFSIYLWIDRVGTSADVIALYTTSENYFKKEVAKGQLHLKDITEEGIVTREMRYEIDRMRPNHGASGDLARLKILYQYGGIYLDPDIIPGDKNLLEIAQIWELENQNKLMFCEVDQGFATDLFICAPGNESIQAYYEGIVKNYHTVFYDINEVNVDDMALTPTYIYSGKATLPSLTYRYDRKRYIEHVTLEKTGSVHFAFLVRALLQNVSARSFNQKITDHLITFGCMMNGSAQECVESPIAFIPEDEIRKPLQNTGSEMTWLARGVRPCGSIEEALESIKMSVIFEVNILGVLRLDDHITNLLESQKSVKKTTQLIPMYCSYLDELITGQYLILEKVRSIQLTFKYRETRYWCENKGLLQRAFVFPYDIAQEANVLSVLSVGYQPYCDSELFSSELTSVEQVAKQKFQYARLKFLLSVVEFYDDVLQRYDEHKMFDVHNITLIIRCVDFLKNELEALNVYSVAEGVVAHLDALLVFLASKRRRVESGITNCFGFFSPRLTLPLQYTHIKEAPEPEFIFNYSEHALMEVGLREIVEMLNKNPKITILILKHCDLHDRHIESLLTLKYITTIDLSYNNLAKPQRLIELINHTLINAINVKNNVLAEVDIDDFRRQCIRSVSIQAQLNYISEQNCERLEHLKPSTIVLSL